jgi:hypothetical protein
MTRVILGIAAVCLSAATAIAAEKQKAEIGIFDIPQVCRNNIGYFARFTDSNGLVRYKIAEASFSRNEEGVVTYSYERRIWGEPRPVFADNVWMQCQWTEGGNIYFSYEEPSPINRPENYHGEDSRFVDSRTYSPDGKTLLEQEIVERDFGESALFTLTDQLRAGVYHVDHPKQATYIVGKVASEITDTNPETGALMVAYAQKKPSKGKIHFYAASRYLKKERGIEYRILERFQYDKTAAAVMTPNEPENFHMVYGMDARGNITYIEKEIYDFSEESDSIFKLEKTKVVVKKFKYTTGIKFEGHNVFDEALITEKDPETGACIAQTNIDYHYTIGAFERPVYWMDVTHLQCPDKKKKKRAKEPETIVTKRETVTWDNLPLFSATAEIERALIYPGVLMGYY